MTGSVVHALNNAHLRPARALGECGAGGVQDAPCGQGIKDGDCLGMHVGVTAPPITHGRDAEALEQTCSLMPEVDACLMCGMLMFHYVAAIGQALSARWSARCDRS